MTPASKLRGVVERMPHNMEESYNSIGTRMGQRHAQECLRCDISAALSNQDAYIARLEGALHPGSAYLAPVRRGASGKWESWQHAHYQDSEIANADAWCARANAYEQLTGKQIEGEQG